jgi:Uma2 family endonuclease
VKENAMAIQEKIYSAADLWELSHDSRYSETRLELSEGSLIRMSPGSIKHGLIATRFLSRIDVYVEQNDLGYVSIAETGYLLFKGDDGRDTVRAPDIGFFKHGRLPGGIPDKGYALLVPDLAIEVVSPNDTATDIQNKVNDYLKAKIPLFGFFYPDSGTMNVWRDGVMTRLTLDDVFEGGDVLPGFRLNLREVMPK